MDDKETTAPGTVGSQAVYTPSLTSLHGVAWVGFAGESLLTTWTPLPTPGAHLGHPEATLSKTTFGLTLPSPAVVPFTVVDLGPSGPALPFCLPPIPWAPSEVGQEPPRPPGPDRRLRPHCPLRRPPLLQNPRLRQAPLSRGAGKISNAASLNTANKLPLTALWYTGLHNQSPGGGVVYFNVRLGEVVKATAP